MPILDGVDYSRYRKWVEASHALVPLIPGVHVFIQGLGKLDSRLVVMDGTYAAMTAYQQFEHMREDGLTEQVTLSVLWALGGYEVIRTIAQRVRASPSFMPSPLIEEAGKVKVAFERVRVPLAKFEKAKRNWPADRGLAIPAWSRTHGISWNVWGDTYVSRRQLSDQLLDFLTQVQRYREEDKARRAAIASPKEGPDRAS